MNSEIQAVEGAYLQIRQTVSEVLACEPQRSPRGLRWIRKGETGIQSAVLRPCEQQRHELDVLLASVPETATFSLRGAWDIVATLVQKTELTAVPVICTLQDESTGKWQITARLTLRDAAFTLPRLNRLSSALEQLDNCAKIIQAELPASAGGVAPKVPQELKGIVELLVAHTKQDSGEGNICQDIYSHLEAGMPVAVVGAPLRVRLELDRLAKNAANIAVLQNPIPMQRLPQFARMAKQAGLILASPCSHLRPRVSVYEQGREIEGMLQELTISGLPMLTFGKREELESVFGVGQGRSHSPLLPVIQTLPAAENADLVRVAFSDNCGGLPSHQTDRLIQLVLDTMDKCGTSNEDLLQPLSKLVAERGICNPDFPKELESFAKDIAGLRDTFGSCAEAPARTRPADVCSHLMQQLGDSKLEELFHSRLLGQDAAVCEFSKKIWQEAICRPNTEPLRVMLAGPVGTGKSVAVKYLAELLHWPHHYIDATAYDSPHAVMTSLAGASPGIVNSYNDGVLAKISRQPSVVEVADLDHAQPNVRGALCEFFLRILQEGTLQTGSGMIIRSIPQVIFIFTSNIAYGTRKASNRFGFGNQLTREEIRQHVVSRTLEHLGHAFISRVGQPIIFDEFTRETAIELTEAEIQSLVSRVTGAEIIESCKQVSEKIVDSFPTLEAGARGILDATRAALSEALRDCVEMKVKRVCVSLKGHQIVIKAGSEQSQKKFLNQNSQNKDSGQAII